MPATAGVGGRLMEDLQPRYKNSAGSLGIWNGDRLFGEGRGQALCGSMNTGKLLRRLEAGST